MLISSRQNPSIKRVRCLSSRKHRDRTGLFLVEGLQLVAEAALMRAHVSVLVIAPDLLHGRLAGEVASIQERTGAPALFVTPEVLSTVSARHAQQGIAAVVHQRWERLWEVALSPEDCWVAVKEIRQPWSIGTIIRMCDAVGASGVILIGDSTDPYDPTAVRASLGTVFSQHVVKASFAEFAAWKRRQGCFVVGTSPAAAADYRQISYPERVALFMGSERVGLSPEQEAICDAMVSIPMVGRCPSHHVSVATGIVLYEIFSQRHAAVASWGGGADEGRHREIPGRRSVRPRL
jgi:TrmH family RNA methyltransferase